MAGDAPTLGPMDSKSYLQDKRLTTHRSWTRVSECGMYDEWRDCFRIMKPRLHQRRENVHLADICDHSKHDEGNVCEGGVVIPDEGGNRERGGGVGVG